MAQVVEGLECKPQYCQLSQKTKHKTQKNKQENIPGVQLSSDQTLALDGPLNSLFGKRQHGVTRFEDASHSLEVTSPFGHQDRKGMQFAGFPRQECWRDRVALGGVAGFTLAYTLGQPVCGSFPT
jgi:hypothetical protein